MSTDVEGQSRRSSIPNSAGDPPLFMSGHQFADLDASRRNSQMRAGGPAVPQQDGAGIGGFRALTQSESSATTATAGQAGWPEQQDSAQADAIEHVAGSSVTDAEAALYEFPAAEDEELKSAVDMLNQHQRLKRSEAEDIHMLELTSRQLAEMVDNENDMCHIEYFDTKYFRDEASKVWEERRMADSASGSRSGVRLFAAPASSILQQAKLRDDVRRSANPSASAGPESFALKHPLLHRRAARNEERRAVFRAAAVERAAASEVPSMRSCASMEGGKSIYSPQRDLFGKSKPLVTFAESTLIQAQVPPTPTGGNLPAPARHGRNDDDFHSDSSPSDACSPTVPPTSLGQTPSALLSDSSSPISAAPTKSLSAMMKEQQVLLAEMKTHDEQVYRPVLEAFYRYDNAVQEKMTRLLAIGTGAAPSTDAKE
jgi:hypothetical protein